MSNSPAVEPAKETRTLPWWRPFCYQARPEDVIDGDSLDLTLDLGFMLHFGHRVRLLGIDTAELPSWLNFEHTSIEDVDEDEFADALAHREFVVEWLVEAELDWRGDWPLVVSTTRTGTGKFGRILGEVWRKSDGDELTSALMDEFGEEVYYNR